MSELARIKKFRRYRVDAITDSSTGPMVALSLRLRESDAVPYFEFAVDPQTALEMSKSLCDAVDHIQRARSVRH